MSHASEKLRGFSYESMVLAAPQKMIAYLYITHSLQVCAFFDSPGVLMEQASSRGRATGEWLRGWSWRHRR